MDRNPSTRHALYNQPRTGAYQQLCTHIDTHTTYIDNVTMPAELNGLPANGTGNGINGHANELSNPTPADSAFDSIPDVVAAFGQHIHSALQHTHR